MSELERQAIDLPWFDETARRLRAPVRSAVRAGNLLYVSGMAPLDMETGELVRGDIRAQTRGALEVMRAVLDAGGSSLGDVVKVTIYCNGAEHYGAVNEVYAEYFGDDPPARTFLNVGPFYIPIDIEIECVAVVRDAG